MKVAAACLVKPGRIEIREREMEMTDDSLRVRILGNGICGTDVAYFQGRVPGLKYPRFFGHEGVGVIEEVGRNVSGYRQGDLVTGWWGGYSSRVVVSNLKHTMEVPEELPVARECAMGDPLQCVMTIVRAARPEVGDSVAVVGCGFMGLMCISVLAGQFLENLIGIDLLSERLSAAEECGATMTINAGEGNVREAVLAATEGRGVDVCIEIAGKAAAVDLGSAVLKRGRGRLVLGGLHPEPATYNLLPWATKGLEVLNPHPSFSSDVMDDMRRGVDALARGVFPMEKLITHRFKLEDTQKVFEQASGHKGGYIKGVLVP